MDRMSDPGAPSHLARVGITAMLVALCVLLAALMCWPASLHPGTVSLDQATPGHLTFAASMSRWGIFAPNRMIAYPEGQLMAPLALPVQILTLALGHLVPTIAAWNLSVVTLVALQGLAFVALGAAWGWTSWQRLAALIAAETCPLALAYVCNGQVEQIGLAPLALITWALWRFGWIRLLAAGFGLALALLSSPYQAIIAGPLVLVLAARHGLRRLVAAAGMVLVCALAAQWVLQAEQPRLQPSAGQLEGEAAWRSVGERDKTPPVGLADAMGGLYRVRVANTAALVDLIVPRVGGVLGHRPGDYVGPGERVHGLLRPLRSVPLTRASPTELPVAPTYLGALTLLAGVLGLWRARGCTGHKLLGLWAALCFLLALGPRLSVYAGHPTGLLLPWALLEQIQSLALASSTVRFLPGVAFACVLGIAWLVRTWRAWQVGAFAALLAATNLLFAPAQWPRTSVDLDAGDLAALIPPGPVAMWPGVGEFPTEENLWLAVALDRPVAVFNPQRPTGTGGVQAAEEWLAEARSAGVRVLLERLPDAWRLKMRIATPPPLPPPARALGDVQGYRAWLLDAGGQD
jgi:hypothetical protein